MKLRFLFILLTEAFATSVIAQSSDSTVIELDSIYGKPIIVLTIFDPWQMVIGSDSPVFALYENGQIIYQKSRNDKLDLYEVKLTQNEISEFIESLNINDSIYSMQESILISAATDQPENLLYIDLKEQKYISVYANLNRKSEDRNHTSVYFLNIFDSLSEFEHKQSRKWVPEKIEIMMWDYDYAPDSCNWLTGFPDLASNSTIKFSEDSFSLFIDKFLFDEFIEYYKKLGARTAIKINDRKMAIEFRMPFPNY